MGEFLRVIHTTIGLLSMLTLVWLSIRNDIEIHNYARFISGGYTLGAMVGPDNLTKIFEFYLGKKKDEKTSK